MIRVLTNTLDQVCHYDRSDRRIWVVGMRLHHGLMGAMLTTAGAMLMAHDWHDRAEWFRARRRGYA